MIASDDPWVRQPVVGPGALKRSASIRTQRCSISAEIGYSAWSMKLRCRFSAMIRCASGSIQVVTKVARLRCGSPSRFRSSPSSRMASVGRIPVCGKDVEGAFSVRNRLPYSASAADWLRCCHGVFCTTVLVEVGLSKNLQEAADREADGAREGAPVDQSGVEGGGGRRPDEGREPGEEEQDRTELVDRHHPPRERMDVHPDATPADLEHREVPGHEEADAAEDVREPDPAVGLAGGEPLREGRDEADREQQRPDEQHGGAQPVAPLRLVAPPQHGRPRASRRRRPGC